MGGLHEINPAGFTIHSAIHTAREDAQCVLHVHSVNGVAVSAQASGMLPISQHSIFVLSSLAYHDYEGLALNEDEKPRLVRDLGDKRFLMRKRLAKSYCQPQPIALSAGRRELLPRSQPEPLHG